MNNYILNKLDVKSHSMEVLYISDDYKSAINYMHEYVEANYDKEHNCVYVKDNNRIFQYLNLFFNLFQHCLVFSQFSRNLFNLKS